MLNYFIKHLFSEKYLYKEAFGLKMNGIHIAYGLTINK